jgi:hypothetical protein
VIRLPGQEPAYFPGPQAPSLPDYPRKATSTIQALCGHLAEEFSTFVSACLSLQERRAVWEFSGSAPWGSDADLGWLYNLIDITLGSYDGEQYRDVLRVLAVSAAGDLTPEDWREYARNAAQAVVDLAHEITALGAPPVDTRDDNGLTEYVNQLYWMVPGLMDAAGRLLNAVNVPALK